MRTCTQILGGVVLGLGRAFALDASPGLIFAGYTDGLGVLLLCLGLLLPDDPDAADGPGPLHGPRPKRP